MAEPAKVNFTLYRGVKRILRFTMTENGSVLGWTTRFAARTKADAENAVLDVAGAVLSAGSDSTPGVFTVTITKALSVALDRGVYAFSFERTDSGSEDLLTLGKMTVEYDVRNAAS